MKNFVSMSHDTPIIILGRHKNKKLNNCIPENLKIPFFAMPFIFSGTLFEQKKLIAFEKD